MASRLRVTIGSSPRPDLSAPGGWQHPGDVIEIDAADLGEYSVHAARVEAVDLEDVDNLEESDEEKVAPGGSDKRFKPGAATASRAKGSAKRGK